jgi:hypothetical protein
MTGYYSLGLAGYEVTVRDEETASVLFVGTQREQIAHDHKIQYSPSGRAFVRTYGRRIYLDQCLRIDFDKLNCLQT